MKKQLIVLTGGPGAGKTAVLQLARKLFCKHVVVLPEAATIVFGGGFWRENSVPAKKAAQLAIYHVGRQLEEIALAKEDAEIILCDRGSLDGLAYWPTHEKEFFQQIGTTKEAELRRYSAVIHLRTPAAGNGYNWENPIRIESAAEARKVDQKILRVWESHPNRNVVNGSDTFLEKAERALYLLRSEILRTHSACEVSLRHVETDIRTSIKRKA